MLELLPLGSTVEPRPALDASSGPTRKFWMIPHFLFGFQARLTQAKRHVIGGAAGCVRGLRHDELNHMEAELVVEWRKRLGAVDGACRMVGVIAVVRIHKAAKGRRA